MRQSLRNLAPGIALAACMLPAVVIGGTGAANASPTRVAHLTPRQVHRVERIVHHLPYCSSLPVDEQDAAQDCRNRLPHRRANASFHLAGRVFYVEMHRGQLAHVEVYR